MSSTDELCRRFGATGDDVGERSPFNAGLCRSIAGAPDIAAILQSAPAEQQLPVLLLAAVHSIVLAEPELELGRWYPTVTDEPLTTDPFPAFAELCRSREPELRRLVAQRVTQTNEVGRSALFLPALGLLEHECGPLSIVDVGTSAGLNLHLDEFAYRYEPGGTVGDPSPVEIVTGTRGAVPVPDWVPELGGRVGIDRDPIDLDDDESVRWLLACIWPDQPDRFHRLQAAIEIAHRRRARVVRGDAVDDLGTLLVEAAANAHPVVLNSWVLNYLSEQRRLAYVAVLESFGAEHDLSWVFAESPAMCSGLPFSEHTPRIELTTLTLVSWRGGVRSSVHLGVAHPHGYWLHWA